MTVDLLREIHLGIARLGSQKILASRLGISESELSKILNGTRSMTLPLLNQMLNELEINIVHGESQDDRELVKQLVKRLTREMSN